MAIDPTDPDLLIQQVHKALTKKGFKGTVAQFQRSFSDISINTTTQGASTLKISLIDPEWVLLTSGFLDTDDDGRLDAIDINFPQTSKFWWRLTQVEAQTDLGAANVTLTF